MSYRRAVAIRKAELGSNLKALLELIGEPNNLALLSGVRAIVDLKYATRTMLQFRDLSVAVANSSAITWFRVPEGERWIISQINIEDGGDGAWDEIAITPQADPDGVLFITEIDYAAGMTSWNLANRLNLPEPLVMEEGQALMSIENGTWTAGTGDIYVYGWKEKM